jgi:hypothetical protein
MRLFTIDKLFDSMSFNYHARKVRNSALPIAHRYSALCSCLTQLSWLAKQPYGGLCSYFHLQVQEPMTEAQLLDRLTAIEVFRNRFLEKLRHFDRKRLRQKLQGRRQPGKKAVQALYNIEALEKPLPSAGSMSSV